MQDERWKFLCEEASTEQDPVRLGELIREINDLIQEKHRRVTENLKTDARLPRSTKENALADEA